MAHTLARLVYRMLKHGQDYLALLLPSQRVEDRTQGSQRFDNGNAFAVDRGDQQRATGRIGRALAVEGVKILGVAANQILRVVEGSLSRETSR